MPDWACRRCGEVNLEGQAQCGNCGRARAKPKPDRPAPLPMPAYQEPAWMKDPRPCTAEENYRAAENVRAVLDRDITVAQAHLVLHAIFQGREKEL